MPDSPPDPDGPGPDPTGEVRLSDLFGPRVGPDPTVTGMTLDSRQVRPGQLYLALPGRHRHGAQFAADAAGRGAVAVLTDVPGGRIAGPLSCPVLVVSDPRQEMARLAARIYREPSRAMTMYAVTGTNGKTTTSYLVEAALRSAGRHVGVIGTIGFSLDGTPLEMTRTTVTTPESPELQSLLARLRDSGADATVMEVSSHALALGRVDAITFDVAAFTNFGRDHLDFHGDLESYFEAKASLFTPERARACVLNLDDPRGPELLARCRRRDLPVITVSLADPGADVALTGLSRDRAGRTVVAARLAGGPLRFALALPGDFNVRNALTALAMVDRTGVDVRAAAAGLAEASVPGRMQRVPLGPGAPVVYVDFAHTPQAVAAVLAAVEGRRCVAVLGCGGDRDPAKRRPMGAAAARGAAAVVVTDDNPRGEDPAAIRAAVLDGARAARAREGLATTVLDGGDRRAAIGTALRMAGPDDVVVVLGKGHETGQEIGGTVLPFSDVAVVGEVWAELSSSAVRGGA